MADLYLTEAAKSAQAAGDLAKAGVIFTFVAESPLMAAMPWLSTNGPLAYTYIQEGALPSYAYRGINGSYTASQAVQNPISEPLKIAGGECTIDRVLADAYPQRKAFDIQSKVRAIARGISYQLIEGAVSSDPKGLDGLKSRIPASAHAQSLANVGNSDALSISYMRRAKDMVDRPTHWLMSQAHLRAIDAYLRSNGTSIAEGRDQFGQTTAVFMGLPILIADQNGSQLALQSNEEGGSTYSSLFCLSIGLDAVHGLQQKQITVEDLGTLQSSPKVGTRVEWVHGLATEGVRWGSRLYHIDAADIAVP